MNLSFDIEDSSILNTTYIEEKALISKNLRYRVASLLKYRPSISKFQVLHFCVLQYRSMPTLIQKNRPSISKLHIVPDIELEAKTLTFDMESLVFDIVHILISGILLRYGSLARFQMPCHVVGHKKIATTRGPGPQAQDKKIS